MRNAFADEILRAASADSRVVLLSGDIGNRLFDGFKERFAARFYNCGVAEANMVSVAAGLAMCGLRPVAYTIAPFITTRCLEQIRVDVAYHRQPVVLVGVGAGLSYASLGGTHHACEDIAFLRALPGMAVVCPGDPFEVRAALKAALAWDGPVYLRLGKKGEPAVHPNEPDLAIGRSICVRKGTDVALLAVGTMLPVVCDAADRLAASGVSARVESFHTLKPLDQALLAELFDGYALVATIEEHSRVGGAGGAVAEWLAARGKSRGQLLAIGTEDAFFHEAGSQDHARSRLGLDAESIAATIMRAFDGGSRGAA